MHPDQVSIRINLAISRGLLEQVDDLSRRDYVSRSALIRQAIVEYLRQPSNAAILNAKPGEDPLIENLRDYVKEFHPEEEI